MTASLACLWKIQVLLAVLAFLCGLPVGAVKATSGDETRSLPDGSLVPGQFLSSSFWSSQKQNDYTGIFPGVSQLNWNQGNLGQEPMDPAGLTSPTYPFPTYDSNGRPAVQTEVEIDFDALRVGISEAWQLLLRARKGGARETHQQDQESERIREYVSSTTSTEWYISALALSVLLVLDVCVLQQFPETELSHVSMLFFWLLLALAAGMEVGMRLGGTAFADWAIGYLVDVFFSMDLLVVLLFTVAALDVPKRLVTKVMFFALVAGMVLRITIFCGFLPLPEWAGSRSYGMLLGTSLVYCGLSHILRFPQLMGKGTAAASSSAGDNQSADAGQTSLLRCWKWCLGSRLCEFYDEDGEAVFVLHKGQWCMTLLGVSASVALAAMCVFSADDVVFKAREFPDVYLNVSSSILALFTMRALFFCCSDVMIRMELATNPKFGLGPLLVLCGLQFLWAGSEGSSIVLAAFEAACLLPVLRCLLWLRRSDKRGGKEEGEGFFEFISA